MEATFDAPTDDAYAEAADDSVVDAAVDGAIVDTLADEMQEPALLVAADVAPDLFQQALRPNASFSESENRRPGEERGTRGTQARPGVSVGIGGSSGVEDSLRRCGSSCVAVNLGGKGLPVPNLGGGEPIGGGLVSPNLAGIGLPASLSASFLEGIGLLIVDGAGLL